MGTVCGRKIAQFTRFRGKSGTLRFARLCYQTTIIRVLSRVSVSSHLGMSKRMALTSSAKMFAELMILEMESHFRDRLIGHLIAESSRYPINTKLLLIQKYRTRVSINFQQSRWIVKRSYCRRINTIGRTRMHLLGIRKRFSIDFRRSSQ